MNLLEQVSLYGELSNREAAGFRAYYVPAEYELHVDETFAFL